MRWIFFVLVFVSFAAAAERRVLEPWEQEEYAAVGRITSPYPGGSGTGTLIAQDTVLTAAHLFFDDGVLRGAPERFTFSVGASLAERCAVRSVHRLAAIDAALLRVRCEGRVAAPAWRCGAAQASGAALLVGFHADVAAGTARRIERCRYRRLPSALLLASCDARAMASGAPLFVLDGGQPLLAAVVRGVGMPADALGVPDWRRRYLVASTLPGNGLAGC